MEYIPEVGLLVHDLMWVLFITVLSAWVFWLWPEMGVAILVFKPQILYNTEFTAGLLGHKLALDYVLMIVMLVRLWFVHSQQQEHDRRLFREPFIRYSLLLTGLMLVHQGLATRNWNAFAQIFRQIEGYVIPVFGILIFSRCLKLRTSAS